MFVLTPRPSFCAPTSVNRVNCIGHYPSSSFLGRSERPKAGSRPRKEVDFVVSSPSREYRNTTASTRDETLVCFCLSCANYRYSKLNEWMKNCEAKKDLFLKTLIFCSRPTSCVQLCTSTGANFIQFKFKFKIYAHDLAEVKRYWAVLRPLNQWPDIPWLRLLIQYSNIP